MAISSPQNVSWNASAGGTTVTKSMGSNVTAGNLLVVTAITDGASITSVADNLNGAWTNAVSTTLSNTNARIDYFANTIAGTMTVTYTFSASGVGKITAGLYEWTGIATASPNDQTAILTITNRTAGLYTAGPVTLVQNEELLLACSTSASSPAGAIQAGGSGWAAYFIGSNATFDSHDFTTVTGGGSQQAQWNFTTGGNVGGVLATFKGTVAAFPDELLGGRRFVISVP